MLTATAIPGLLHVEVPVGADERGWFLENYPAMELAAAGAPPITVAQGNVSVSEHVGVTRGVHAEPWNKFYMVATGRLFAAIVDLRAGAGFGRVVTFALGPGTGLYIPRGCGNAHQSQSDGVVITYLVDGRWRPGVRYPAVQAFDPALGIDWPIGPETSIRSAADRAHPPLAEFACGS